MRRYSLYNKCDWGGVDARANHPMALPATCVMYAYTMTLPCRDLEDCKASVRAIQTRQMMKYKLADIRFNFVIDPLGNVYIGRGWKRAPQPPKRYRYLNNQALFIGMIGCRETPQQTVDVMYRSGSDLIHFGVDRKFVTKKHLEFNI